MKGTRLRVVASMLLAVALAGCVVGCAGRKKKAEALALLTAEARLERGQQLLRRRKLAAAVGEFGKIDQYTAENRSELEPLVRLGLADATFYQSNDIAWIDARSLYLDFVTLYGDHSLAPYSQFQAGICSLKQVNHPSRDQSQTEQAITDLSEVLRRFPGSRYAAAARLTMSQAQDRLAEHEFLVGKFYLKRKRHLAAADRFRRIVDLYPSYGEKEKLYYFLGKALIDGKNPAEGRIYMDKLVRDYPEGKYAGPARKALAQVPDAGEMKASASP